MSQGSRGGCHEKADPGDITLGPLFGHSLLDPLAFKLTFKYIMDDNGFQEFREVGDGEKRGVRKCCEEHFVLRGPRKPYFPAQPPEP